LLLVKWSFGSFHSRLGEISDSGIEEYAGGEGSTGKRLDDRSRRENFTGRGPEEIDLRTPDNDRI
jgi:hypothetical protein